MNKFIRYIYIIFLLPVIICAQNLSVETDGAPVTIHRSIIHKFNSAANGVTYPIYVALPGSYKFTNNSYPVIYMLDAYSSFGIVVQIQRLLQFNKEVPEAIIVGISSEGGSKEFNFNRSRDYTPTIVSSASLPDSVKALLPACGGADKFLSFIKNELIPFIDTNYRTKKDDHTLLGHSLGGLFCFYTLFSEPTLFQRFVILSPYLSWDNNLLFLKEEEFSKANKSLSAVIYSAVGGKESPDFINSWQRMIDRLKKRKYEYLKLTDEIIPNETHYSIIPFMATHGLKNIFSEGQ